MPIACGVAWPWSRFWGGMSEVWRPQGTACVGLFSTPLGAFHAPKPSVFSTPRPAAWTAEKNFFLPNAGSHDPSHPMTTPRLIWVPRGARPTIPPQSILGDQEKAKKPPQFYTPDANQHAPSTGPSRRSRSSSPTRRMPRPVKRRSSPSAASPSTRRSRLTSSLS